MLRFKWTPDVTTRAYFFYPLTTQEAPWSSTVLAFVWTTAYLCVPGQLSIGDSMDTVKISKRFACANKLSKWHFVKLEDLGSGGGSRGGAPVLFLDQTEARRAENILWRPPPLLSQGLDHRAPPAFPLSEGLDRTIRHCIIYSHYSPVPPKPFLAL